MLCQRAALGWIILVALIAWFAPVAIADECPERIEEANALIREAEQVLVEGGTMADRPAILEKLQRVKAFVDEALTLHNNNAHDASVEKAYLALATMKEVLKVLKP